MNDPWANVNVSATNEKLDQLLANSLPPRVAIAAQLLAASWGAFCRTEGRGRWDGGLKESEAALRVADALLAAHEETK